MTSRWRATADDGWTFAAAWLLTRALSALVFRTTSSYIVGDVMYYHGGVSDLALTGLQTLGEYPVPAVGVLALLRWISGPDAAIYLWVFVAAMLALDAGFTWLLWRQGGRYRGIATGGWILFLTLVGPLAYMRFDLAPAVLAGAAALWAGRRPGAAGGLIGLGAALKLWPVFLIAPLLSARTRARALVGMLAVGGVAALISLVAGGWSRLLSPLTWMTDRGLQIESVPASGLMWQRAFSPDPLWIVGMSPFHAYEIWGPGRDTALAIASALTLVGYAAIAVIAARAIANPRPTPVSVAITMVAIVAVLLMANKTLSPQYMMWLGAPAMAAVSSLGARDASLASTEGTWVMSLAFGALLLAGLTQIVYPLNYTILINGAQGDLATAVVLVARNAVLVAYTLAAGVGAWSLARRTPHV